MDNDNEEVKKSLLDEKAIEVLKKPKNTRTADELNHLLEKLKGLNFIRQTLKKCGEEVVTNILNCLNFIEVPAKHKILVAGEEGRECYILLQGEIDVYTPDPKYEALPRKYWRYRKVSFIAIGNIFGERSMVDKKPR
jgi:hypothetical protein